LIPQAVAHAKETKNLSYSQIAEKIGEPEQRVVDRAFSAYVVHQMSELTMDNLLVCTGKVTPSKAEFDRLAIALEITNVRNDLYPQCPVSLYCALASSS